MDEFLKYFQLLSVALSYVFFNLDKGEVRQRLEHFLKVKIGI